MLDLKNLFPDQLTESCLIDAVYDDSQAVKPQSAFVALKGERTDGHQYVKTAFANGASVVVVEVRDPTIGGLQIVVPDTYRAVSEISAKLHPLEKSMVFIGITGTDGKTSTAVFLQKLLTGLGKSVGYIGTNGLSYAGKEEHLEGTTPLAAKLFPILADMSRHNVDIVAMEVSSHALATKRVIDIAFDYTVFTNFSHDHLDYHKTFGAYKAAKLMLFKQLREEGTAVINLDEAIALDVIIATGGKRIITYGLQNDNADFLADDIAYSLEGMTFTLHHADESIPIETMLLGEFNIYNVLTAIAIALDFGYSLRAIAEKVKEIPAIEGRMELFYHQERKFAAIVDFGHAPSAIKNVLLVARKLAEGRVIVVTGAVGDGDRKKRPLMAEMALKYTDEVIFTTDQPYSEEPAAIIAEMTEHLNPDGYRVILERGEAIKEALDEAYAGDVVVVLGKGRETEIKYKDKTISFSDYEFVKKYMKEKK